LTSLELLAFSQTLPSRQFFSSISMRVLPAVDVKQDVLKVKRPFLIFGSRWVFSLGRLSYSRKRCTGSFGLVGWGGGESDCRNRKKTKEPPTMSKDKQKQGISPEQEMKLTLGEPVR